MITDNSQTSKVTANTTGSKSDRKAVKITPKKEDIKSIYESELEAHKYIEQHGARKFFDNLSLEQAYVTDASILFPEGNEKRYNVMLPKVRELFDSELTKLSLQIREYAKDIKDAPKDTPVTLDKIEVCFSSQANSAWIAFPIKENGNDILLKMLIMSGFTSRGYEKVSSKSSYDMVTKYSNGYDKFLRKRTDEVPPFTNEDFGLEGQGELGADSSASMIVHDILRHSILQIVSDKYCKTLSERGFVYRREISDVSRAGEVHADPYDFNNFYIKWGDNQIGLLFYDHNDFNPDDIGGRKGVEAGKYSILKTTDTEKQPLMRVAPPLNAVVVGALEGGKTIHAVEAKAELEPVDLEHGRNSIFVIPLNNGLGLKKIDSSSIDDIRHQYEALRLQGS